MKLIMIFSSINYLKREIIKWLVVMMQNTIKTKNENKRFVITITIYFSNYWVLISEIGIKDTLLPN